MVFAHRCYKASLKASWGGTSQSHNSQLSEEQNIFQSSGSFSPSSGRVGEAAVPDWNAQGTSEPKEMILITQSLKELQLIMSDYVGIVRNNIRLQRASRRLDLLWEETEDLYKTTAVSPQLLELRNMITVGYLIVKGASFRKESRGLHFNTDYPGKSKLVQNIVL
jgi:L-aspartate oxidase